MTATRVATRAATAGETGETEVEIAVEIAEGGGEILKAWNINGYHYIL